MKDAPLPLSLKDFRKHINDVFHDYMYYDAVCDAVESDFLYEHLSAAGSLLELLGKIFDDTDDWLGYFAFELEWGTKYQPGVVLDKAGHIIPLATVEDIYNLLLKNYQEKHHD